MKEAAYKGMVHPILEYGSSVWDPYTDKLQEESGKVQNRTARSMTRNYVNLVNIIVYTKFGQFLSICSPQDIEKKRNSGINQEP